MRHTISRLNIFYEEVLPMSDHSIPPTEPNLSELKKVRLEKLKELQETGIVH